MEIPLNLYQTFIQEHSNNLITLDIPRLNSCPTMYDELQEGSLCQHKNSLLINLLC